MIDALNMHFYAWLLMNKDKSLCIKFKELDILEGICGINEKENPNEKLKNMLENAKVDLSKMIDFKAEILKQMQICMNKINALTERSKDLNKSKFEIDNDFRENKDFYLGKVFLDRQTIYADIFIKTFEEFVKITSEYTTKFKEYDTWKKDYKSLYFIYLFVSFLIIEKYNLALKEELKYNFDQFCIWKRLQIFRKNIHIFILKFSIHI